MVDPWVLSFDIVAIALSTAIPGIVWAVLFALTWRHPAFAASLGLGASTFWLLLPGAILASFALLPVAPVSTDIVAVSFAGAVFPLGIAVAMLGRIAEPLRRWIGRLFLPLVLEAAVLVGVVIAADAGGLDPLAKVVGASRWVVEVALVSGLAVAMAAALGTVLSRRNDPIDRAASGIFGLTTAVLVLTYVGAQAIPGVGITEVFPYYLVPPVLAGVVAAVVTPRWFPGREGFAIPAAFFSAGWGVALGADVLWQPPLYGTGPSGLYAVGGAGVLDLVYLSALLGLLGAWGTYRALGRPLAPVGPPVPPTPPSPGRQLREAYILAVDGAPAASLQAATAAARNAGLQAQRLTGRPVPDPERPWSDLPVSGWVVSDQANLESLAGSGTNDPREAWRGYVTARALVRIGEMIGRPRFATIAQRLAAFAIDLGLLGLAAAAVFVGIVVVTPGGLNAVLTSVGFSAAVYGFVAVALLYFALGELWFGATVGKALLGIEVLDRSLGRIGGVAAFVRNAPLLPVVTIYSFGLSTGLAIAMDGLGPNASLAGFGISSGTVIAVVLALLTLLVLAGVALCGAVGIAVMAVTSERQRVGDLWADTWVVRRLTAPGAPRVPSAAAARSG